MRFGKALVCLAGAVIAAYSACGMTACREKEIILPEMTAQAPVYQSVRTIGDIANHKWSKIFLSYTEDNEPYWGDVSYDEFMEYYSGEFRQVCASPFYILKPNRRNNEYVYYHMYADKQDEDGKISDVLIEESFTVYDYREDGEKFKIADGSTFFYATEHNSLLHLSIVSAGLENIPEGESFTLEFGQSDLYIWVEGFINIYVGETCVATCYYGIYNDSDGNKKQVPLSWFENYFTENLLLNGI